MQHRQVASAHLGKNHMFLKGYSEYLFRGLWFRLHFTVNFSRMSCSFHYYIIFGGQKSTQHTARNTHNSPAFMVLHLSRKKERKRYYAILHRSRFVNLMGHATMLQHRFFRKVERIQRFRYFSFHSWPKHWIFISHMVVKQSNVRIQLPITLWICMFSLILQGASWHCFELGKIVSFKVGQWWAHMCS